MDIADTRGAVRNRRIARRWTAAASLAAVTLLGACTSSAQPTGGSGGSAHQQTSSTPTSPTPSTKPPAPPAVITASAATSLSAMSPADRVSVAIAHGTLTKVTMTNPAGKAVSGAMTSDGTTWHSTEDLGYSRTYRLTAAGKNADGTAVTKHAEVKTLNPGNQTMAYFQRIGGYPLGHDATYGVAIVPVVHFDEDIDHADAEKALTVTTTPKVAGAWYWSDATTVHWRPQHYWKPGTKVTVSAKIYGKKMGAGLYGQADNSASFTIGRRQLTVADDNAPHGVDKVRVYNGAGKLLRTMNTAMGQHGGVTVPGHGYINFYTLDGTYTVLDHEQPARMCSASYGLPANSPQGYACENIANATKISTDGIYLHYLTTFYAQNHGIDVSHGCLNLNEANSMWFFTHSMVGDPVVVHGAKGAPTLQLDEGGDWTVPWSQWTKGSAS